MKSTPNTITMKIKLGWILLAASIITLLSGIVISKMDPMLGERIQWIMGLALFVLTMSVTLLVSNLPAIRSAERAARKINSETDERNISIRNAAGFMAFLFAMGANYIALFVYSAITRGSGFDVLWYVLASLAVFPVIVFIILVFLLQKRM